jgi:hypothetical protein
VTANFSTNQSESNVFVLPTFSILQDPYKKCHKNGITKKEKLCLSKQIIKSVTNKSI